MKKFVIALLVALILSITVLPVAAGTLTINNVNLSSTGAHYASSWQTKSTTTNGTHVWFDLNVGPLAAVNTRTQANLPVYRRC